MVDVGQGLALGMVGPGQLPRARLQLEVGVRQLGGALLDASMRRRTSTSPCTRVNRLASDTAIEKTNAAKPKGMTRWLTIQPRSRAVSFR